MESQSEASSCRKPLLVPWTDRPRDWVGLGGSCPTPEKVIWRSVCSGGMPKSQRLAGRVPRTKDYHLTLWPFSYFPLLIGWLSGQGSTIDAVHLGQPPGRVGVGKGWRGDIHLKPIPASEHLDFLLSAPFQERQAPSFSFLIIWSSLWCEPVL